MKQRKAWKIVLTVLAILAGVLTASYLNHRILLSKEQALRVPIGQLVKMNGKNISVYTEGTGSKTIVFMSGGGEIPQVPMLLFISDGSGGTGFDQETWRGIQEEYVSEVAEGRYIELNCPHYVHDYEYIQISGEIKSFLRGK